MDPYRENGTTEPSDMFPPGPTISIGYGKFVANIEQHDSGLCFQYTLTASGAVIHRMHGAQMRLLRDALTFALQQFEGEKP